MRKERRTMVTKEDLERKVIEMEKQLKSARAENIYLEDECKQLAKSLTVIGKACHSVYKYYPHILGECCTEPDLIRLFKAQDAFQNFLNKLIDGKPEQEGGEDEI